MGKLFGSDLHSGFHVVSEEDGSIDNFNIARPFGIKVLKNIQDRTAKATGLAFITVDYRGEPVTEMTSFTPFRRQTRGDENAKQICVSSNAFGVVQTAMTQRTCAYFRSCGPIEITIPIIIQGYYLGDFIGGQVRCGNILTNIYQLESVLHHDRNRREDPEVNQLLELIAVHPYEKFFHIASLVSLIINQLAGRELSRLVQKENLGKGLEAPNEQKKEMEAELVALKTQMNPYFLFEGLNAISDLSVVEDAPHTSRVVNLFVKFMKFNFSETRDNVLISGEIENLEYYLGIQEKRVGG